MRKISKTRASSSKQHASDAEGLDEEQISGATISAWSGSLAMDLDAFFGQPPTGVSIAGSDPAIAGPAPASGRETNRQADGTVSLSDGTRITFATASQFEVVKAV